MEIVLNCFHSSTEWCIYEKASTITENSNKKTTVAYINYTEHWDSLHLHTCSSCILIILTPPRSIFLSLFHPTHLVLYFQGFFFLLFLFYVYIWVFGLYIRPCTTCRPGAQRPEDSVRPSRTGVIDNREPPYERWDSNLCPLEEQPVLFTTRSSLQPPYSTSPFYKQYLTMKPWLA